jgi:N-acetylglucosamine kinase-like BadF-type ATPase
LSELDDLGQWAERTSSVERASLFRVLVRVAARGDAMAEGVLRRGARDLAVRTRVLAAELGVGADGEVTVVLAGALWHAPSLPAAFREYLGRELPGAELKLDVASPAYGAARLAARHRKLPSAPRIFEPVGAYTLDATGSAGLGPAA